MSLLRETEESGERDGQSSLEITRRFFGRHRGSGTQQPV